MAFLNAAYACKKQGIKIRRTDADTVISLDGDRFMLHEKGKEPTPYALTYSDIFNARWTVENV